METFILLLAYLAKAVLLIAVAFGIGRLFSARNSGGIPLSIGAVQAVVHGFGALGLIGLILSLVGFLTPTALRVVLAVAVVMSVWHLWRDRFATSQFALKFSTPRHHIAAHHFVLIFVSVLIAVNVTIGALAPDASQDSLWYHLSCARAWLHWHVPQAWPTVYPSGYNLHGSVIYAFALAIGDEVDCSVLYAVFGFLTLLGSALYAREFFGARAALWTWFLCATAYGTYVWFVPINTGSDLTAAMFATMGMLSALDSLRFEHGSPRQRAQLHSAGWFLGWGIVTKLTVLGYAVFPIATLLAAGSFAQFLRLLKNGGSTWPQARRSMTQLLVFLCLIAIPMLFWGVRSLVYGAGNPLFPLFRDLLPLKPEFDIARRNLGINTMYPLTLRGLSLALQSIPNKLTFAIMARSPGFLLHAALMATVFFSRQKLWREIGVIAALQWLVFFWSAGYYETVKYFSVSFPSAFVFVAAALVRFEDTPKVAPRLKHFALLGFVAVLSWVYAARQFEWGNYETVNWPYRPILRQADRLAYLATKPYQLENIYLYDAANRYLPSDAVVLFPDNAYPFYLDRTYLWVDDDLDLFQYLSSLSVSSAEDVRLYLSDRRVTHVIMSPQRLAQLPIWQGVLEPVPLAAPRASMRLYKVKQ